MTFRDCDETAFSFSWVAQEPMTRTSHALAADGRVWLVDPVDWPDAIERARSLGKPAAVLQLLETGTTATAGSWLSGSACRISLLPPACPIRRSRSST